MIGAENSGRFGTKASESRHLLPFFVHMLREHSDTLAAAHGDAVDIEALIGAGQALVDYMDILCRESRVMSHDGFKALLSLCRTHCDLAFQAGVHVLPKHHLFYHLTVRIAYQGNPRFYHTYLDESLNKTFALLASSCYRSTFEKRLFQKYSCITKSSVNEFWY